MNKLIIIISCFLLTAVFSLVLAWPKYQSFQGLRDDIKEKQADLESKEQYFSQIKEISRQLEEYQDELTKVSSALPKKPSLPSLFNFFQTSASESGLILKNINLGGVKTPKKQENSLKEISLGLELLGSYKSFKSFLETIEGSSRMIEIENLSLAPPTETQESNSFSLEIKTYSY
ncbi:MAG: type 4a pilus biogenesis protein PilO [Candidatus Nealsonbacteria bacterium]|nr:type 4a pilus biogenesis protein PilO [Candidatus Nealsonbacteria bacterium]